MLLNNIELTNIGPYMGTKTFDFEVDSNTRKNVILIGGENGAGKTTLLNSIKLGLFGAYAFGYKTDNSEYFKQVKSFINNNAKKLNENNFRITINFIIVDELKKVQYTLHRYWMYKNDSIREFFKISADEKDLTDYESELFQSKIKEVMPPQLLDLCLFNGEEIFKIVNQNLLAEYIQKLSRVVFNLDLFETLEQDLELYINQNFDVNSLSRQEKEIMKLRNHEKEFNSKLEDLSTEIITIVEKKDAYEEEYRQVKNNFETYGGLVKDQRDAINNQIKEIELQRKLNSEKIKEFVSNLLPFLMTKNLVEETREQISKEEKFQLYTTLEKSLTKEKLINITSYLELMNSDKVDELKDMILDTVKPDSNLKTVHNASFSESTQVENIYNQLQQPIMNQYLSLIEENRLKLTKYQQLREQVRINDKSSEFTSMIDRMEHLSREIYDLEQKIIEKRDQYLQLDGALNQVSSTIDNVGANLRDKEKTRNSFIESQKIITLSQKFRKQQLQKKLQQVQFQSTNMLKHVMRKHNYISSLKISADTFDVTLYDINKDEIEKSTLSAGEKQILLLSVIWAIFKCSKRRVPFIFDSLLGRLDRSHKETVLKEMIPKYGEQVIILSTDTEIDSYHYKLLYPHISKEYSLDFDVESKSTNVDSHYFTLDKRS